MNRIYLWLALLIAMLSHGVAEAASSKNLAILGEDSGSGAVLRDSRPFEAALDMLRGRLASYYFTVYDEASLNVQLGYTSGKPRDVSEVLEVVSAVKRPPIELLGVFSLFADVSETSYGSKFSLRMTAKLMTVPAGKVLGTYVSRTLEPTPLPKNCSDDCLLEAISEKVESIALDLGDQISRAIPSAVGGISGDCDIGPCPDGSAEEANEYRVILRYPTGELTQAFEELAMRLPYAELKPITSDRAEQSYWLRTSLSVLELKSALQTIKGKVRHTLDLRLEGSTFELRVPN